MTSTASKAQMLLSYGHAHLLQMVVQLECHDGPQRPSIFLSWAFNSTGSAYSSGVRITVHN